MMNEDSQTHKLMVTQFYFIFCLTYFEIYHHVYIFGNTAVCWLTLSPQNNKASGSIPVLGSFCVVFMLSLCQLQHDRDL